MGALTSPIGGAPDIATWNQDQRQHHQGGQRDPPVEDKHQYQGAAHDEQVVGQPEHGIGDHVFNAAHVIVHPGEQVAGAARGVEAHRLLQQPVEKLLPQVVFDALADRRPQEGLQHADQPAKEGGRHPGAQDQAEPGEGAVMSQCQVIDERFGDERGHQAQASPCSNAGDGDEGVAPVGREVAENAPQQRPSDLRLAIIAPVQGHARPDAVPIGHGVVRMLRGPGPPC